jgi:signal peptidase I
MIRGVEALRLRKKRKGNPVIGAVIKVIIIMFFIYMICTGFFVFPVQVGSESMNPVLKTGDRIIASPLLYGPGVPFFSFRFTGIQKPARGDLVLVIPPYYEKPGFFGQVFEPVLRFFTLQKKTIIKDADNRDLSEFSIKRIIGLPGDTIRMQKFAAYIKPKDSIDFIHEYDLIEQSYTYIVNQEYFPDNWLETFPFSGTIDEITLQPGEYFVLGDNRTQSNDSTAWGPLPFSRVAGKIIFQYWPIKRFGIP